MKAAGLKPRRRPPKVVRLPPSCFHDGWSGRPTAPIEVGLRRPSAGENEFASIQAVEKVDEFFPGMSHHDPVWKEAYDVALLHILLSFTLTKPDDVDTPLWPRMDGGEMVGKLDSADGAVRARNPTRRVVSRCFSPQGIGRLYDEMHVLAIENNPLYPELDDGEIADLFATLPETLAELEAPTAQGERDARADQRRATAAETRRMLGYLQSLLVEGMQRPPMPVEKPAKQGASARS